MKQALKILTIGLILFYSGSLSGQDISDDCSYVVDGEVYNLDTEEPIPYVTVSIKGTNKGTVTNENGQFRFEGLCEKEYDLVFSHIGYKTLAHHHDYFQKDHKIFLAPNDLMLQSIVVLGESKIQDLATVSFSKIDDEMMKWHKGNTLGNILEQVSGVSSLSTGQNIVKPMIHGLHSNRILIVNNGINHEFQNWGAEHAPEIDPTMAENIEILKGAASVRYGPEALGGVVLINQPELQLYTDLTGDVGIQSATNGRSIETHGRLQKGFSRFSLMGSGTYYNQGDLRAPDYFLRNTGRQEYSVGVGGLYHFGSVDLESYYSHFSQNLGILRGSVTGSLEDLAYAIENEPPAYSGDYKRKIDNPRQQVTHDLVKLNGKINTPGYKINFRYGYQVNKRQEFDVRRGTNNDIPSIDLVLKSHTFDADWAHPELGPLHGLIGIQTKVQQNSNMPGTNTIPFIPNYNRFQIGMFAIEKINTGNISYEAGIRYDFQHQSIAGREPDNEVFSDQLNFQSMTATVGLSLPVFRSGTFRSNLGTGWRPPNISELYSYGKHSASIEYGLLRYVRDENNNVIIPDDVLTQEEKDVNPELSVKWTNSLQMASDRYHSELTVFVNYIKDYIYAKPAGITNSVRGAFPFYVYEQDNTLLWGIDYQATIPHNDIYSSTFSGSYLWARDIMNNDFFVEMPPPEISYRGTLDIFPDKFERSLVRAVFQYVFRQNQAPRVIAVEELIEAEERGENLFAEDDSNFDILSPPEGYFIINLEYTASKGRFDWSVQLNNLLNNSYRIYTNRLRYFANEPGFNLRIGINFRI
jgi:iron complex outermembrane receptor protein